MPQQQKDEISNSELLQHMQQYASSMEAKIDSLDKKIDERIAELSDEMNNRFDSVTQHMKNAEAEFAANRGAHQRFEEKLEQHDKAIVEIKKHVHFPA